MVENKHALSPQLNLGVRCTLWVWGDSLNQDGDKRKERVKGGREKHPSNLSVHKEIRLGPDEEGRGNRIKGR